MTREQIKSISTKIECGGEQGTGFFVTPNHILTAYHVVRDAIDENEITISNDSFNLKAKLVDYDKHLDIALLYVDNVENLPCMTYSSINSFDNALVCGYIKNSLAYVEGLLLQTSDAISLQVEKGQRPAYNGLSGSAIISNGHLAGIAQIQIGNIEIVSLPTNLFLPFLERNNIKLKLEIPFEKELLLNIDNLGPRYSPEINVKLPIAQIFDGLALNENFVQRNRKAFKKCMQALNVRDFIDEKEINDYVASKSGELINLYRSTDWKGNFNAKIFITLVTEMSKKISEYRKPYFNFSEKEEAKRREIDGKRYWLGQYIHALNALKEYLRGSTFKLAEHRCLLLKGDAGMGKSHLLADIAKERLKAGFCSVLVLGDLMNYKSNYWDYILDQCSCKHKTKEQFLENLNLIGQKQNNRVLLMIDALNEGEGLSIWKPVLTSLINEVKKYQNIGLVLSIRSTYEDLIIPKEVKENKTIVKHTHEGFKGNEYEALCGFCEYYKLEKPNISSILENYSNPLFLTILFEGLPKGTLRLPEGLAGITTIYKNFLIKKNQVLADPSRLHYETEINLVQKCLNIIVSHTSDDYLDYETALDLLEDNRIKKFCQNKDKIILYELIRENIINKKKRQDNLFIDFSFNQLGDYIRSMYLFDKYKEDKQYLINLFKINNIDERYLELASNKGILLILAIAFPEKTQKELFEIFPFFDDEQHEDYHIIVECVIESLVWRNINRSEAEKIKNFFNSLPSDLKDFDLFFSVLLKITTYHNNPFNSDYLHQWLSNFGMAERDGFWLPFLRDFYHNQDDGNPLIVKRLVDWAWQPNAHSHLNDESVRLAAQTLTWFLASPNRDLRDHTTKGLICLLDERPLVLLQTLQAFENVDDMYISERLYAVTYGCVLRAKQPSDFQAIGQYIFDTIFSKSTPPRHVLLRDYARNTIEFLLFYKVTLVVDMSKIKPPYKTEMLLIPSDEEIDALKLEPETKDKHLQNGIHFSILEYDFRKSEIDGNFSKFFPVSFTKEAQYMAAIKILPKQTQVFMKEIKSIIDSCNSANRFSPNKKRDAIIDKLMVHSADFFSSQIEKLPVKYHGVVIKDIKPYFDELIQSKKGIEFKTTPIAKWIIKRVFDLGWSMDLHSEFDIHFDLHDKYEPRQERISQKYTWIAFHEAITAVADNYYFLPNGSYNKEKGFFQGPWQLYLRDIDPSFVSKAINNEDEEDSIAPQSDWNTISYGAWHIPKKDWLQQKDDIPKPNEYLSHKDENGVVWIALELHLDWKETVDLKIEKYGSKEEYRIMWHQVRGYFVLKKAYKKSLDYLQNKHFMGLWMPQCDSSHRVYCRENIWSPVFEDEMMECAYNGKYKRKKEWRTFGDNDEFKGMSTVYENTFEQDKSGGNRNTYTPCKLLFEKLALRYGKEDGTFVNAQNEIVCFDPSIQHDGFRSLWMRAEDLAEFLDDNNLEMVWTLLGEKQQHGDFARSEFSGVYIFDKNKMGIKGDFQFFEGDTLGKDEEENFNNK